MKRSNLPILLAAAALCSAPAFAQDPGPGAPVPPDAPPPEAAAPAARGPVLPRVMPSGAKFESLSPAEREHVRRMAEFRAARDAAERDIFRLRQEVEERRASLLEENEEAKTLFDDAKRLFEEYSAKTNALQAILENDETISGLFKEMEPLEAMIKSNQRALNAETVSAMKRRMEEQRKEREARLAEKKAAEEAAKAPEEENETPVPAPAKAPAATDNK